MYTCMYVSRRYCESSVDEGSRGIKTKINLYRKMFGKCLVNTDCNTYIRFTGTDHRSPMVDSYAGSLSRIHFRVPISRLFPQTSFQVQEREYEFLFTDIQPKRLLFPCNGFVYSPPILFALFFFFFAHTFPTLHHK